MCPFYKQFPFLDFLSDQGVRQNLLHLNRSMLSYCFINLVCHTHIFRNILLDTMNQITHRTSMFTTRDSACHSATRFMSKHKQHLNSQMAHCIFHAAHHHITSNIIPSCPDDKNIAHTSVKEKFYRDTGI